MGVLAYWLFATSKDITIGPVAVVSVLVGQTLEAARHTHPDIPSHVIASAIALVAGIIIVLLGLLRLGWVVDLIPLVSISAFMTGSAISIAVGQLPVLLGIKGFNTRESTFLVFYNTLERLSSSNIDAVVGLTALATLYTIRQLCTALGKKYLEHAKVWFFASTLRTVGIIALYTTMSYLVNRNRRDDPRFSILRTVPAGFQNVAIPAIDLEICSIFATHLPATILVLLLEHIAIAKSFGRLNNYTIDASQEMVAIGITNIVGPFLGAYPATGSFSRTAIKSKAGVKTPLAGVITGVFVLIAIYALPAVFFYIPNAALSAVIIHAVLDLITSPSTIVHFWRLSPAEVPIFFFGVLMTIFCDIEVGIYTTVAISLLLLLVRVGSAKILLEAQNEELHSLLTHATTKESDVPFGETQEAEYRFPQGELLLKGIVIFTPSSSLTFLSTNTQLDTFIKRVFATIRRTNLIAYTHPSQRPWNDTELLHGKQTSNYGDRPTLKAVVIDFGRVKILDLTAIMRLADVRKQLDAYANPQEVQWHFANIANNSIKQTLLAAGFGTITSLPSSTQDALSGNGYGTMVVADEGLEKIEVGNGDDDLDGESSRTVGSSRGAGVKNDADASEMQDKVGGGGTQEQMIEGFHFDLTSAVHAAMINVHNSGGGTSRVFSEELNGA